jgi:hypothetical protein
VQVSSDLWVYALIRRVQLAGGFATIVRKGDARGGAVLVKTYAPRSREAALWSEAVGPDGGTVWMHPIDSRAEADIDAYVSRAARIDPDIWVVEIEDDTGERFLTEPTDPG